MDRDTHRQLVEDIYDAALHRDEMGSSGYFSAQEIESYHARSKHLMKAIEISRKLELLEHRKNDYDEIFDKLHIGILLTDKHKKIVHQNYYANQIIQIVKVTTSDTLDAALGRARKERKSSLVNLPRPGKKPVALRHPRMQTRFSPRHKKTRRSGFFYSCYRNTEIKPRSFFSKRSDPTSPGQTSTASLAPALKLHQP